MNLKPWSTIVVDLQPGETTRVNHTDCPAGEDTRRRLYLTRVQSDPTRIVGYCHNCSDGGAMFTKEYESFRNNKHSAFVGKEHLVDFTNKLPPNLIVSINQMPIYAAAWLIKANISQTDVNKFGIGFNPSTDRIVLPRYTFVNNNNKGTLWGYQERLLTGQGPKYINVSSKENPGYTFITGELDRQKYVIVEDLLSGIAINKTGVDHNIIVNYGTRINPLVLGEFKIADEVIVWLDNDSEAIDRQAEHYARTIDLHAPNKAHVVKGYSDPKHHNEEEIVRILNGFD